MLNRAEFEVDSKVNFWNGEKFIRACVVGLALNPIDNIIEYRLFYREGTDGGKRARVNVTCTPYFIEESKHFKEPKKVPDKSGKGSKYDYMQ